MENMWKIKSKIRKTHSFPQADEKIKKLTKRINRKKKNKEKVAQKENERKKINKRNP